MFSGGPLSIRAVGGSMSNSTPAEALKALGDCRRIDGCGVEASSARLYESFRSSGSWPVLV